MPRRKISEYRAKTILSTALGLPYTGLSVDVLTDWRRDVAKLSKRTHYVVKVDQGVKGRFKKGLVKLNVPPSEVPSAVTVLIKKGYRYILIEPYRSHQAISERYLAMERTREGNFILYSARGGVDIESDSSAIKRVPATEAECVRVEHALELTDEFMLSLSQCFDDNYFSFLEINPLIVENGVPDLLDAAVEVDDAASTFVSSRWTAGDFRELTTRLPEEIAVEELAATSQASFSLKVLNPDGAVFVLLSGGGASVTVADEVNNLGFGKELANYGEYSGAPNEEETYIYTKQVLSLMLKSKAKRKVLIIGGGVANFTDVRKTFSGVLAALGEFKTKLKAQHIKVYVRRGGPFQAEGLAMMEAFLLKEGLHGQVSGPEIVLSAIIPPAVADISGKAKS